MGLGIPEMMAIGGGVGLLTGGLRGGLTGAALGGLGGAAGNAFKGANFLQGASASPISPGGIANGAITNALAGGDVAKGLTMNASMLGGSNALAGIPGTGAFEASMGLNNAYNAGSLAGLPGAGTIESVMGQAGADGVFRSKDYFANVLGNPVYTGDGGLLSQIGTGASSIWDTAKANLPDYVTPQNVVGAANILSNIQPPQRQMPTMSGGGVRQGQTQGLNVPMGGAQLIRRRGQA
mgnify:CR=1 FL=1